MHKCSRPLFRVLNGSSSSSEFLWDLYWINNYSLFSHLYQPFLFSLYLPVVFLICTMLEHGIVRNFIELKDIKCSIVSRLYWPESIKSISVAGSPIKLQSSIKNLGVHLDSRMSFDKQVSETCKASYYHIRALRHIRSSLTTEARDVNEATTPRGRGHNPRGWGHNPRGRGHNPRGRGQDPSRDSYYYLANILINNNKKAQVKNSTIIYKHIINN